MPQAGLVLLAHALVPRLVIMDTSEEQKLADLMNAAQGGGVASATTVWRAMTSRDQEVVVLKLLGVHDPHPQQVTQEIAVQAEQTEVIPKSVDDLRRLTGPDGEAGVERAAPDARLGSPEYWAQWRRRWKWSVLVTAWAMATVFAFDGAFDSFGPEEWAVGILGSIVFSALLVGTLINFAVALIPSPHRKSQAGR